MPRGRILVRLVAGVLGDGCRQFRVPNVTASMHNEAAMGTYNPIADIEAQEAGDDATSINLYPHLVNFSLAKRAGVRLFR